MKGVIITNQEIGHNAYKINRFKDEFSKRNIELEVFANDGSLACIDKTDIKINLPKCDFVLYLDKDIYLARELEKNNYRLFDSADFMKFCDDKILTQIGLANLGIRMPKTIASPLVYTSLKESNFNFLKTVEKELSYPMVVKKVYGSLGEGVYLVNNYEELRNLYSQIYRNPLLFQEYISSSYGRSMRVLIIDNEIVGAFIRTNEGDFRSNFGTNASSTKLVGHDNYLEIAKKISNILNIEYAGLDFLFGENDEPILCEINSNAFFEEFEKVTGIDVAKIYADMIVRKIYK